MNVIKRARIAVKAARQLGWDKVLGYARYQYLLRSGALKRATPAGQQHDPVPLKPIFNPPAPEILRKILKKDEAHLLADADRIVNGEAPIFGNTWVPMDFSHSLPLNHWTTYKGAQHQGRDIKFTWEPARFGWATTLARAWHLSREEKYAKAFWRQFEVFRQHNPANLGPHWSSAQEVALRMICMVFAQQVMAEASATTPERKEALSIAIAEHASRIPPTLLYARAQNNNHLLTEAAGLFTAACIIPDHPDADKWRDMGWEWLNIGLQEQIADNGTYIQHSANYHRLMLQTALWVQALLDFPGHSFPAETLNKLKSSTLWLLGLVDQDSGRLPNLGPNDGAYILPLTTRPFADYRPVLQTASYVFLGAKAFADGPWDEMVTWFSPDCSTVGQTIKGMHSNRVESVNSWGYLRSSQFTQRPGHADLNHVDLWWKGENIALDAGTYLYNADAPWNNSLAGTDVHNTIMIDGQHQMTKAGKFLWLDWAQGRITDEYVQENGIRNHLVAQHDGCRQQGIIHERSLSCDRSDYWVVTDNLLSSSFQFNPKESLVRLHWLLPDNDWYWNGPELALESPNGPFSLKISSAGLQPDTLEFLLVRAGKAVFGEGEVLPNWGWYSPTYGVKIPALSVSALVRTEIPITLVSEFTLPASE